MPLLAAISLTAPLMLAGMAAIALPLLAHLLNRRARRRVTFPTIRLLADASATQSAMFRLRRRLLLALRCLAIVLIVAAFARPVWTDSPTQAAEAGDAAAVILVIDASASAGQQAGGVTLTHRLRAAATDVLDALEPGRDLANVIFAGARPRPAYPQPVANLDALRADVRDMAPTQERADLPAALAEARRMLAQHPGPRRLVLISDMQRTNWAGVTLDPPALASGDRPIRARVLPVDAGDSFNIALSDPHTFPNRPIAGRPAQLAVTVTNHTDREQTVAVEATLNGRTLDPHPVALGPREGRQVTFDATFDAPGQHRATFSIPDDDLAADNRAYLVAEAVDRVPVVVIGDDDPDEPTGSSYFLSRALAPRGGQDGDLLVRHMRGEDVTAGALAGAEAVLVGDVALLPERALRALHDYAEAGGGILIFSGEGAIRANAAALEQLNPDSRALPWLPIALRPGPLHITGGAWSTDALTEFDDLSRDALRQVVFRRSYTTTEPADTALTLLRFDDGSPALSLLPVGRGEIRGCVMLANFSPSPRFSDLAKHGVFVALLHALTDDLRPDGPPRTANTVGRPLSHTLPTNAAQDGRLTIVDPEGNETPATLADGRIDALPTTRAGFHDLQRNGQTLATVALNLDPRESDLRPLTDAELRQALGEDGHAAAPLDGPPGGNLDLRPRPLWHWFILAALLVIGLELALLTLWKR